MSSGLSVFRFIIELLVNNELELFILLAIIPKTNLDLKEADINEGPQHFVINAEMDASAWNSKVVGVALEWG